MTPTEHALLNAFETHAVDEIRRILDSGVDAVTPIRGKAPLDWLTEMYTRSGAFPGCLRLLFDRGASLSDCKVEAVLLNDATRLDRELWGDPSLVTHRVSMVSCFTPLADATLLHVAAEYGHAAAVEVLLRHGADVNARAGDGHTPIFHAVNANANRSRPVLDLLLKHGADVTVKIDSLVWGHGFEWETTLFDVTPLSYAQLGLLPQMHRNETQIYDNIRAMLAAAKRPLPPLPNVPNRYLQR